MEYKLGNSRIIKDKGNTSVITCPKCSQEVKLGVFSNFERRLAIKPSLLDLNTVFFLVCPNCAALYTVDESLGEKFANGEIQISADDLTELEVI